MKSLKEVKVLVLAIVMVVVLNAVLPSTIAQEETIPPEIEELALAGVESNDDWEPYIQEFDGVEMVLVPTGCFMMGSESWGSEEPVHEQCFEEPFWIDKFEVTNEQFGSVGCTGSTSEPDQPRNCVTWFEAVEFCESRGARLPTEREWEYAARGPDSLVYPWGNTYDAAHVIGRDDPTYGGNETAPVGSRPSGASWVGAMDMSGNLLEWTSTIYTDYPYDASDGREDEDNTNGSRVLRGGSVAVSADSLRAANRGSVGPRGRPPTGGFRCARDYE